MNKEERKNVIANGLKEISKEIDTIISQEKVGMEDIHELRTKIDDLKIDLDSLMNQKSGS